MFRPTNAFETKLFQEFTRDFVCWQWQVGRTDPRLWEFWSLDDARNQSEILEIDPWGPGELRPCHQGDATIALREVKLIGGRWWKMVEDGGRNCSETRRFLQGRLPWGTTGRNQVGLSRAKFATWAIVTHRKQHAASIFIIFCFSSASTLSRRQQLQQCKGRVHQLRIPVPPETAGKPENETCGIWKHIYIYGNIYGNLWKRWSCYENTRGSPLEVTCTTRGSEALSGSMGSLRSKPSCALMHGRM